MIERPKIKITAAMSALATCPDCSGERKLHAFVDGRHPNGKRFGELRMIDCMTCEGAGTIPTEKEAWIVAGRRHRTARVAHGESMKAAADRLGISPVALNAMESGRADPAALEPKSAEAPQ